MSEKGLIFDIQRYSIHDGPGIRTVVFLKGCPLRCKWCANPESLTTVPQLFYIKSRCIHCGTCIKVAPKGLISMEDDKSLKVDFEKLNNGDLSWVHCCPTGAMGIKGQYMSVDEVFSFVMRDEMFYRQSKGGITLSGGEPLLQKSFVLELLKRIRNEAISTAVETSGMVPYETLESVRPYVSLFLFDLKHPDSRIHQKYTGVPNTQIIENLTKLAQTGATIMVRTPLIPEVNDGEEAVSKVMRLLHENNITHYALLPFHEYGKGKYASIGREYALTDIHPPAEQQMDTLNAIVRDNKFTDTYEDLKI